MPSANKIRQSFQDFFAERGHQRVPSGPVFPSDDPTLLFTNAGMNQFKDVFLGTGRRDYSRAVDTQKCIRVSGKHNDLEEVGRDTYHHTFFEMLGNWSFGDYFKAEAIPWAWTLLTEVWGLPKECLWVTVFAGDERDGLPADEESARIWRESTDIAHDHILYFDRTDNFWEMGETGPCGPCTEIHIDRGDAASNPLDGAERAIGVNAGNERFIELWNLVFMQFNRLDDGSLSPLPAKHVDTGMGLERVVSVLQGESSNYDTDIFTPIFGAIGEATGATYGGSDSEADVAFRVIADHVRACSAAFADGALPSNTGRGYVLRRLIRRAARFGRQALGQEQPFLFSIAPAVAATLREAFPEITARLEHIQLLLRTEEEAFAKTLGRGLMRFEELASRVASGAIPGAEAYELYATYGFPRDLVELMARERGLEVDAAGWEAAREKHQAASRSEGRFKEILSAEQVEGLPATRSTYHDTGAETLSVATEVVALFEAEARDVLVLAASPFYPEGGGQIGDSGTITAADGAFRFQVANTQRLGDVVAHLGRAEGAAQPGTSVVAVVDGERRAATRRNHTATHFLHKALREVLGDHVTQQGSYVGPDRLRFDISHPKALTSDELEAVERRVNENVFQNTAVTTTLEELEAAKARGVMALFGEKYSERVRVVDVGGWSVELCGGTHVDAAGDIGPFVIVSEGAIQAGVRRIEAVTGSAAVAWMQTQRRVLERSARTLKVQAEELPARIEDLQQRLKDAKKAVAKSASADLAGVLGTVEAALDTSGPFPMGAVLVDLPLAALRELGTRLKGKHADLACLLLGREDGKAPWIAIAQGSAREAGWSAKEATTFLRAQLGGGGGGKPDLAQGQGADASARERAAAAFRAAPAAAFGA
ncbi:MAG: alanine--tRNA ligase [Planctomycetota bacterium]